MSYLSNLYNFNLEEEVENSKKMAKIIEGVFYDANVDVLRTRLIVVEGMEILVNYFESGSVKVLQLAGRYQIFLPFTLVCNIGMMFLGNDLIYQEFFQNANPLSGLSRKTYIWRTGEPSDVYNLKHGDLRFMEKKFLTYSI